MQINYNLHLQVKSHNNETPNCITYLPFLNRFTVRFTTNPYYKEYLENSSPKKISQNTAQVPEKNQLVE